MNLTNDDIKNLLVIISSDRLTLKANEAKTVAILQQKLEAMLSPKEEEIKEETKKK